MLQVLKAVTILFTICLGLQRKIYLSFCDFHKKKNFFFFLFVIFTRRIYFFTFQIKDIYLAVKSNRNLFSELRDIIVPYQLTCLISKIYSQLYSAMLTRFVFSQTQSPAI